MADEVSVQVSVNKLGNKVYEITGVMKGKFYKRQYIGYNEQTAVDLFEQWLGEQL